MNTLSLSSRDSKVRDTILSIVPEFFEKNQASLLYKCSVQNMIGHKSEGTSQNSKGHKSTTDEHRPFGKNVMTLQERIVDFCSEPKSMADIADFLGVKDKRKARERYVDPQLGITLERTIPDKPTSRLQKYIAIKKGTSHT